ncbi:PREDICTED: uncharacterized protein LOC102825213 [Chrysochloris asiatica]|uniref:Uncharacterized protein LOC102825213 n=1 Tax=Chrysochloris asiatica TaxID=185453 RepID=A0A9B0UDH1_CHRAS|nr:PREDICTED: uncharacterized protein LOC102825213 [Chrysochloris asiatica]
MASLESSVVGVPAAAATAAQEASARRSPREGNGLAGNRRRRGLRGGASRRRCRRHRRHHRRHHQRRAGIALAQVTFPVIMVEHVLIEEDGGYQQVLSFLTAIPESLVVPVLYSGRRLINPGLVGLVAHYNALLQGYFVTTTLSQVAPELCPAPAACPRFDLGQAPFCHNTAAFPDNLLPCGHYGLGPGLEDKQRQQRASGQAPPPNGWLSPRQQGGAQQAHPRRPSQRVTQGTPAVAAITAGAWAGDRRAHPEARGRRATMAGVGGGGAGPEAGDFLARYRLVSNKLKKRFLRKPNVAEAGEQFGQLGRELRAQECLPYAAWCQLAVARCQQALFHGPGEALALTEAARLFLRQERDARQRLVCPAAYGEPLQAPPANASCSSEALGAFSDVLVRCEVSRVLLLLLLQPPPAKLLPEHAHTLEKYSWEAVDSHGQESGGQLPEELFLLLQSLVMATHEKDTEAVKSLQVAMWPLLSAEQNHLLHLLLLETISPSGLGI